MNDLILSPWFDAGRDTPVNDGEYEIKFHDGHVQKCRWYGAWGIPNVYIKAWRGVVR